jgi:hypothetical protein
MEDSQGVASDEGQCSHWLMNRHDEPQVPPSTGALRLRPDGRKHAGYFPANSLSAEQFRRRLPRP